jgi:hypothetical protein
VLSENWGRDVQAEPEQGKARKRESRSRVRGLHRGGEAQRPCVNPFLKTTAANVQFQGSRLQGDRITIPAQ